MPPTPDPIRLELELDSREDPIQGHLGMDGVRIPFTGWLELMAAMQKLTTTHDATAGAPTDGQERQSR
jgi:hypothetical protein